MTLGGRGGGGEGEGSPTPQGKKRFLSVEGTPMGPATFWERTPFACGNGGHMCRLPAYRTSPAQPRRTARWRQEDTDVPGPLQTPRLVSHGSANHKSTKKGGRTDAHPSAPAPISQSHPSGNLSVASAHSVWRRGRGVLSEDPSFSLSRCIFIGRTHT